MCYPVFHDKIAWRKSLFQGRIIMKNDSIKNSFYTILKLAICILIPLCVGWISSFFSRDSMQQYKELVRPSFSPPGWVFPVVWTALFILMGIASFRIYTSNTESRQRRNAIVIYTLQLAVNFFWTILFFTLRMRGTALLWLILLWILIFLTIKKFYKVDRVASWLMVPYIAWVSFAGILNYQMWFLNKG